MPDQSRDPGLTVDLVEVDKHQGTYEAMSYLLSSEHTRIGCIVGISSGSVSSDPVSSYRRAMKDYGVAVDERLIVETQPSVQGGHRAAMTLLDCANPPTAIFAHSDRLALGVLRAARDLSITVPDELSVIGHDDEPDAMFWTPALTTIRQPQYEMGIKAATLLYERMENPNLPPRQVIIQPQLILRESTARPPKNDHDESNCQVP